MLKLNDSVQKEKHKGMLFLNELEVFAIQNKWWSRPNIQTQMKENETEQVLT